MIRIIQGKLTQEQQQECKSNWNAPSQQNWITISVSRAPDVLIDGGSQQPLPNIWLLSPTPAISSITISLKSKHTDPSLVWNTPKLCLPHEFFLPRLSHRLAPPHHSGLSSNITSLKRRESQRIGQQICKPTCLCTWGQSRHVRSYHLASPSHLHIGWPVSLSLLSVPAILHTSPMVCNHPRKHQGYQVPNMPCKQGPALIVSEEWHFSLRMYPDTQTFIITLQWPFPRKYSWKIQFNFSEMQLNWA